MSPAISEAIGETVGHDFLFTWKPKYWPHDNLRELVETFRSSGTVEELWNCAAHKKIRPGDRAYLLEQGNAIGIFGRGTVIGDPEKKPKPEPGDAAWRVLIGFEALRGDVLWDPVEQFLVDEDRLLNLPVPKKQWQHRASGVTLATDAARAIDKIIFDSVTIGRGQATWVDREVARVSKLVEQRVRPEQQRFRRDTLDSYRRCAVTGCVEEAALEAAHIAVRKASDINGLANGILLRSDIHRLFDGLLITLSEDGTRVEVSPELTDPMYAPLKAAVVARPDGGPPPSAENIQEHRNRFFERLRRRSG